MSNDFYIGMIVGALLVPVFAFLALNLRVSFKGGSDDA